MKNRAKCKLCGSIIESFHATDYVECKCGHISVSEGEAMKCAAIDFSNFVRVDDQGNEIIVTVKKDNKQVIMPIIPTKSDLIDVLDGMIKDIESMPQGAMSTNINHYDFCSLLILLSSILKAD